MSLCSPFFLQPIGLDQSRSSQMLVSGLPNLTFLVLYLKLGMQKAFHSYKLMQGFGLKTCLRLVNFLLCCHSVVFTH